MFHTETLERSRTRRSEPVWWTLYTIALGLVTGMGALEVYIPVGASKTVLEGAVVIVAFGLMLFWCHCNRARWL